jgi:hypothetical protein
MQEWFLGCLVGLLVVLALGCQASDPVRGTPIAYGFQESRMPEGSAEGSIRFGSGDIIEAPYVTFYITPLSEGFVPNQVKAPVGCHINSSQRELIVITCTGEFALKYIAKYNSIWADYHSARAIISDKIAEVKEKLQELEVAVTWAVYTRDPNYDLAKAQRTETGLLADLDSLNRQSSTPMDFLPLQEWVRDRLELYVAPLPISTP